MNYLQLCQRVRQECGITGNGPSTVVGQVGELKSVADWVREAWLEIQVEHMDWKFMWNRASVPWAAGYSERSPADLNIMDFDQWGADKPAVEPLGEPAKRREGALIPWARFSAEYASRDRREGALSVFSAKPNDILVSPVIADKDYLVTLSYYREPQHFSVNGDVPYLKSQYHDYIVYRAVLKYAAKNEAGNIYADAQQKIRFWQNILNARERPVPSNESVAFDSNGDDRSYFYGWPTQ